MITIEKSRSTFNEQIGRLYYDENAHLKMNSRYCKTFTFQITEDCNLRCSYCYQINKSPNKMTLEIGKKIVDCIFKDNYKIDKYYSLDNMNGIILDFIGGEPLLEVDLIDKIMDYFVEQAYKYKSELAYKYRISISTNGTLYNEPKVQKFLEKWRDRLSLTISLDGCKELHDACRVFPDGKGSYDKVVEAAKKELEINPYMDTKMTLAPSNLKYFLPAIKNLINLGYKQIFCNYVFEKGWTIDDAINGYKYIKEVADYLLSLKHLPHISFFDPSCGKYVEKENNSNWCGGTGLMLAVNYAGNFYPCLRYMESSLGTSVPPYIIGNIYEGIMNSEDSCNKVNCLTCITRSSQSTQECMDCPINGGCSWCSAYNYQEFGTPNKRATYICDMHKARVMGIVYFWNKIYRLNNSKHRIKLNLDDESCLKIIDEKELSLLRELERE